MMNLGASAHLHVLHGTTDCRFYFQRFRDKALKVYPPLRASAPQFKLMMVGSTMFGDSLDIPCPALLGFGSL